MYQTPEQKQKLFELLDSKGFFDQRNATLSLYFDNEGTLQTIRREDFLFKNKK